MLHAKCWDGGGGQVYTLLSLRYFNATKFVNELLMTLSAILGEARSHVRGVHTHDRGVGHSVYLELLQDVNCMADHRHKRYDR